MVEVHSKGQGFALHELGVLAAQLEHLIYFYAIGPLQLVFEAHGLPMAGGINEGLVDAASVTYLMVYIQGYDTLSTFCGPVRMHKADPCH